MPVRVEQIKEACFLSCITTVSGDIKAENLGFCQSHEHLFIAKGHSFHINPDICINDEEKSIQEARLYKKAGGDAVVDAQPIGTGRDAAALERISRESGVHIIASTGFHKLLFYPREHWIFSCSEDMLSHIFIRELTAGMYGLCDEHMPEQKTHFRAGQIKAALDSGSFTDTYRKLFLAAANAANQTGRVLMVHIEAGSDPVALAEFLGREKVNSEKIVFCHLDRAIPDLGVHKEICARKIALEYDTIARPKYHSDQRETEILLDMLKDGCENRILMGLDTTRARLKSYDGNIGLDYILNQFVPALMAAGVPQKVINKIFTDNPARIFSH